MLYFSKIKLLAIYLIIIFLSFFSFANFLNDDENFLLSKNINLGLDLQGGSYLLLEVDSKPLVNQRLQEKIIKIRDYFKKNDIKYKKLSHNKEKIIIIFNDTDVEKFVSSVAVASLTSVITRASFTGVTERGTIAISDLSPSLTFTPTLRSPL